MANPQLEEGYLSLARRIQDAFCKTRIPGEVRQIVDVVIRQTYGYKRKQDDISLDRFCELTGMKKPTVSRSIKSALEMNLIIKNDNENRKPATFQFNKNYEEWRSLSKKIIKKSLSKVITTVIKNDNLPPLTLYVSKKNSKTARTSRAEPPQRKTGYTRRHDDNDPMDRENFVRKMRESSQPHIRFIGEYADEKKLDFKTKGQWREFIDRNLRPAKRISSYSEEQIAKAFEKMKKDIKTERNPKGFITKWGIETIEKYLDN